MLFRCETCNFTGKTEQSYKRHLSTNKHELRANNLGYKCVCGNIYMSHQSLYLHRKTICTPPNKNKTVEVNTIVVNEKNDFMPIEEQIKELKCTIVRQEMIENERKKEMEEMKAQISLLLDNQVVTHNSTNTNIENQNNITININAFGNENTDYLDDKAILQCIDRVYKSIPALLQKIHFDPQHPENHNIKISNKKLPYASVMGTNQIWKTMDRKDAIDKMVTNGYYILDEKYETNKEKFEPRKQKNFEGFKESFEAEDKTTIKTIRGDVEMMVINGG